MRDIYPVEWALDEDGIATKTLIKPETRDIALDYYEVKFNIDQWFTIREFAKDEIPSGKYALPFSFILPKGLPASFNHSWLVQKRQCFADISYTVTA